MVYEVIQMNCMEITTLVRTKNKDKAIAYCKKTPRGRIRVNGKIYTIRESETFCGAKWKDVLSFPEPKKTYNTHGNIHGVEYKRRTSVGGFPVEQLDVNGRVVNHWDSLSQAGRALGIHSDTVAKICNGQPSRIELILRWANE